MEISLLTRKFGGDATVFADYALTAGLENWLENLRGF